MRKLSFTKMAGVGVGMTAWRRERGEEVLGRGGPLAADGPVYLPGETSTKSSHRLFLFFPLCTPCLLSFKRKEKKRPLPSNFHVPGITVKKSQDAILTRGERMGIFKATLIVRKAMIV